MRARESESESESESERESESQRQRDRERGRERERDIMGKSIFISCVSPTRPLGLRSCQILEDGEECQASHSSVPFPAAQRTPRYPECSCPNLPNTPSEADLAKASPLT